MLYAPQDLEEQVVIPIFHGTIYFPMMIHDDRRKEEHHHRRPSVVDDIELMFRIVSFLYVRLTFDGSQINSVQ